MKATGDLTSEASSVERACPGQGSMPAGCDENCSRCDLPAAFWGSTCECACHADSKAAAVKRMRRVPTRDAVAIFIAEVRAYVPRADVVFKNGSCFGLYRLIRAFRPDARAWYDPLAGHVYTEVDGRFYDIDGPCRLPAKATPLADHKPQFARDAMRWRWRLDAVAEMRWAAHALATIRDTTSDPMTHAVAARYAARAASLIGRCVSPGPETADDKAADELRAFLHASPRTDSSQPGATPGERDGAGCPEARSETNPNTETTR